MTGARQASGGEPRAGSTLPAVASVVVHGALVALVYTGVARADVRHEPPRRQVEIAFVAPPPPPPPETPPIVPPQAARAAAPRPRPAARARQVALPQAAPNVAPEQEVVPEEPVVEESPTPPPPGPPAPAAPIAALASKETVVEAREGANYKHNPRPAFPPIAIDRGWEGTVVLRILVSPEGRAERIVVATSSGRNVLDEAAVATVKGWLFEPARRGALRIAGWVSTPIVFRLQ